MKEGGRHHEPGPHGVTRVAPLLRRLEQEGRRVIPGGTRKGEGEGAPGRRGSLAGTGWRLWLHNLVNALNATEPFT